MFCNRRASLRIVNASHGALTKNDAEHAKGTVLLTMRIFIAAVALMWAFAGLGQSAYALGKHQHRPKKNTNPYAYLAPRKQKKPSGYYQSTLTGEMVYGKKKK